MAITMISGITGNYYPTNMNGRIYPKEVMEKAVADYCKEHGIEINTEITLTANNNNCMKKSVKLDENYFLTTDVINSTVAVEVPKQTNYV